MRIRSTIAALVLALPLAGCGGGSPLMHGATVLERTVGALLACEWLERVVVVVSADDRVAATLPGLASPRVAIQPTTTLLSNSSPETKNGSPGWPRAG